jgi:hypothetical protein
VGPLRLLFDQGIDAEVAKAIGEYVAVSGVLTSLDLRGNTLGDGEAALREIAKDRPSLTLRLRAV